MTDHVARLYATALALVVFFVSWAIVAARPWAAEAANEDPRVAALAEREHRLRRESVRVKRLVDRRFAAYRVRLRERQREIAAARAASAAAAAAPAPAPAPSQGSAAPSVAVVSVPPVTATSTS